MKHLTFRVKAAAAIIVDAVVNPFGFEVYALVDTSLPGLSSFSIVRRPAGVPRTRRLKPRP
ncbi:hypothetical protein [Novosphingobium humi]|uniref:Uncharacterized protein n=1 Tax=Novosphingobium humi TaxID=2282397 RepID=A0ABY7U1L5_9SPHN|nr:hypothetical protein [Novosphingobium humi]WCT78656.1 hypothetical protein PQ457_06750 [Novosphingobium humi]